MLLVAVVVVVVDVEGQPPRLFEEFCLLASLAQPRLDDLAGVIFEATEFIRVDVVAFESLRPPRLSSECRFHTSRTHTR